MIKTIIVLVLLAGVIACAPRVSREASRVAYHHDMSTLLSDCERLGPVTGEYDAKLLRSEGDERERSALALTEAALEKYGATVDNVVFISTVKVTEGKNVVISQGAAFKCN